MDANLQALRTPRQAELDLIDQAEVVIEALQANLDNAQNANSQLLAQVPQLQGQLSQVQAQLAAAQAVQVFDGLELTAATVAGGSVANSAGNTAVAADAQGVPTTLNAFRGLFPNGLAYANKYWYWALLAKLAAANPTKYTYEGRLMLPTAADTAASQALELDIEHRIAHVCFNTALQFDFADKLIRIWNRSTTNHGWISAVIPLARWNPGDWHSFKLETHRDAQNVYYDALTIDSVRTDLSAFSFPAIPLNESDVLNCAIQLDGNSAGTAYQAYIDAVRLTVQ